MCLVCKMSMNQERNLSSTWPRGLSRGSGGDTGESLKRRELFLTSSFTEGIELGVPVHQKVSRSVKLDDLSVLEEHNPVVIYHSSQSVCDRQDRAFSELAVGFR